MRRWKQKARRGINRGALMEKARAGGIKAAQHNLGVHKNPFMEKTLFWMCWKDGYEDAIKELKKGEK